MHEVLTVPEVRAAEALAMRTLPDGALMSRAAAGLATACADLLGGIYGRRILVLAGSGDNGGDALFAGARLARRGAAVTVVGTGTRIHEAGLADLRAAGGRRLDGLTPADLDGVDLVIDGILGIGSRPGLSGSAAQIATLVEDSGVTVVACDLPSGVAPDSGEVDGTYLRAHVTVCFGTLKPGLLLDPAAAGAGVVELVDIGLGRAEPDASTAFAAVGLDDVGRWLPEPGRSGDKYARGVVGVMTGSPEYPGAGLLSIAGARCGLAGMIRFVGDERLGHTVATRFPDVVPHPPDRLGRVQAWVVGSGGGSGDLAVPFSRLLDDDVPVLVDADGLTHLPKPSERPDGARLLLTPHAGELSRLLEVDRHEIEAHRLRYARQAAEQLDATVLLKGATTVVVSRDGRVRVPRQSATPWLATAGSGDVLGGITGALLAVGLDPLDAGIVGALLHASAARLARAPFTAADIAAAAPEAIRHARTGRRDDDRDDRRGWS
jgi:hydroxyethylthiazole kinase-like uncharacterized protein yjeF